MAFVMSKGAVEQIVRVLAKDLGQREITVNAIAAGVVDTPVFQDGKPPHVLKQIASLHPQNRVGTLNEISTAVSFLATKGASWINGQIIAIDGVSLLTSYPLMRIRTHAVAYSSRALPSDETKQHFNDTHSIHCSQYPIYVH